MVFGSGFSLEVAATGAASCTEAFGVVDLEGCKAAVASTVVVSADGGVDHGFSVSGHDGACCLSAYFTGFEGDVSASDGECQFLGLRWEESFSG